jgi:hypothetical protein
MDRTTGTRRMLLVSCVVAGSACVVGDIDLSGRACPCVEGWICDASTDTCRRPDELWGTTTEASGSASTSGSPAVGAFEILELAADWSTPNAIHWTWTVQGEAVDFHAWEIRVATSIEELDAGGGLLFDGSINPELGRFTLKNTGDEEPVTATITDGLGPATEYFARLFVLDTAGGRSVSPNVAVRSTSMPAVDGEAIFADASPFPPGVARPEGCYVLTDSAPAIGSTLHYELHSFCDAAATPGCIEVADGEPECWENLRLQDMSVPISGLTTGDFPDAYLELYIAIEAPPGVVGHGWWSELSVDAGDAIWMYPGLTIRADGEYRRYQLPLTAFGLTAQSFASLAQGVRVGSTWASGSRIRVDEVFIRW